MDFWSGFFGEFSGGFSGWIFCANFRVDFRGGPNVLRECNDILGRFFGGGPMFC